MDEELLKEIRLELYHSKGTGYHIFKSFIPQNFVDHMVEFWCRAIVPEFTHKKFFSKKQFHKGSSNYLEKDPESGNKTFHNFFWNLPPDEVTGSVDFLIQVLRNSIEARNLYNEFLPFGERSVNYRIVITKNGKKIVKPHRDWDEGKGKLFDPKRLQVTLFLTERGDDYSGDGFIFETNQGNNIVFGKDVVIKPGDMVIWRYNNLHSVQNLSSSDDNVGFVRMIMPPEAVPSNRMRPTASNLKYFAKRILLRR